MGLMRGDGMQVGLVEPRERKKRLKREASIRYRDRIGTDIRAEMGNDMDEPR